MQMAEFAVYKTSFNLINLYLEHIIATYSNLQQHIYRVKSERTYDRSFAEHDNDSRETSHIYIMAQTHIYK